MSAAHSTSARVAPSRPYAMFSATVPEKSSGSCVTSPHCRRTEARLASRTSAPSTRTAPPCGSAKRIANSAAVLLPAPLSPTSATTSPLFTASVQWSRT